MKFTRNVLTFALFMFAMVGQGFAQRPMVGPIIINSGSTGPAVLSVTGTNGQSGNLAEFKDVGGFVKASVKPDGTITAPIAANGMVPRRVLFGSDSGLIAPADGIVWDPFAQRTTLASNLDVDPLEAFVTTFGTYPQQEESVWNSSGVRFGRTLWDKGGVGASNQWNVSIQTTIPVTNSPSAYERAGLIIMTGTADPSDYAGPTAGGCVASACTRDAVGLDSRGLIGSGNLTGRAWGVYAEANAQGSSNGILIGTEISMINNSTTDQPEVDTNTSKVGLQVVASGSQPGTVAMAVVGSGQPWHKGLYSRQSYTSDSFIELDKDLAFTDLFRVKPTGQMLVGDLIGAANNSDYDEAFYGIATFRAYVTIADARSGGVDDQFNFLGLFTDIGTSKHRLIGANYNNTVDAWPLTLETIPAGSTTPNEALLVTTDPFLQLTTSYAGATDCTAGTVGIRNNSGTLEACENSMGWSPVTTVGSSYWTRAANGPDFDLYPTTQNDRVLVGWTTTDLPDDGVLIANGFVYATDADMDAHVAAIGIDAGSTTMRVASGVSGAATYVDMIFETSAFEQMRLTTGNMGDGSPGYLQISNLETQTNQSVLYVDTSKNVRTSTGEFHWDNSAANGSLYVGFGPLIDYAGSGGAVFATGAGGFITSTANSCASLGGLTVVAADAVYLTSQHTGGGGCGTNLPLKVVTGGSTAITVTTGQQLQLANALAAIYGGTGQTSYTTGDILYASSGTALSKRAIGSSGDVLTVSGGLPVWAAPAGGGGYFTRTANGGTFDVYPTVQNDRVLVGLLTTDLPDNGVLVANSFVYAVSDDADASVAGMGYDLASNTIRFASGISDMGSYVPMQFLTNGAVQTQLDLNGQWIIGGDNTDIGSPGDRVMTIGSGNGFIAAVSETSTDYGSFTVVSGNFVSLASQTTDGGTTLPIAVFAGGAERARVQIDGTISIGTSTDSAFMLDVNGSVNGTAFTGSGASLTSLSAGNISSGTLAIARGGTNTGSQTGNGVAYYNASALVTGSNLTYDGTDFSLANGDIHVTTSTHGITLGSSGTSIAGTSTIMSFYISSTARMAVESNGSSATLAPLYLDISGTLTQVRYRNCTADGGSHTCLTID